MKKLFINVLVAACFALSTSCLSKIIEYKEDAYCVQASQALIDKAEKAAEFFGYGKGYELISPKKPALEINPLNKFMTRSINPQTKNEFILINSEWFLSLPDDQQQFLFGCSFLIFKHGLIPVSVKYAEWIYILISIALIILLAILFGRIFLSSQKLFVRVLAAILIVAGCKHLFLNKIYLKGIQYLYDKHSAKIYKEVIAKTGKKDVGVQTLKSVCEEYQKEASGEEAFWKPYVSVQERSVKMLEDLEDIQG